MVPLYGPRAKLIKKRNEVNNVTVPASSSSSKCKPLETSPIEVHTIVNNFTFFYFSDLVEHFVYVSSQETTTTTAIDSFSDEEDVSHLGC